MYSGLSNAWICTKGIDLGTVTIIPQDFSVRTLIIIAPFILHQIIWWQMRGSWHIVVSQYAWIIVYLGNFHGKLQSVVAILDCVQQIADPAVIVWQLVSYMLRCRLQGLEYIMMIRDEFS